MRKEKAPVTLKAGYRDGGMGVIFQGEILQVRNGRESVADTYVHVIATSGENGRNYATVNKALASGHTYSDRLKIAMDSFKAMGLKQGFVTNSTSVSFPRNFVAHGMAADLMREICRATTRAGSSKAIRSTCSKAGTRCPAAPTSSTPIPAWSGCPSRPLRA